MIKKYIHLIPGDKACNYNIISHLNYQFLYNIFQIIYLNNFNLLFLNKKVN